MSRIGIALAATLVATSGVVVGLSGPASAASCYHRSGYSFDVKYETDQNLIWVYRGSACSGNYIGYGKVTIQSLGKDKMYIEDDSCDNIGIYGYTHGYSAHPTSCGHSASSTFYLSNVTGAKDWWINVGGSVNSNAEALPA